jgi:hypothetical protein
MQDVAHDCLKRERSPLGSHPLRSSGSGRTADVGYQAEAGVAVVIAQARPPAPLVGTGRHAAAEIPDIGAAAGVLCAILDAYAALIDTLAVTLDACIGELSTSLAA